MDNTMYTGLNSFPGSEFRGGKERLNIQVETEGDQKRFFTGSISNRVYPNNF